MKNKDNNVVLKQVESILQTPRYNDGNKMSPEHIEELSKVVQSNEAVASVLSGLCDAFYKTHYEAVENAKCLVELVQMHQIDSDKGNEMMVYLADVIETEETKLKCIN